MTFSVTDLTTPVSKEQAKTSIYNVLAALGVSTTTWKPGAVVRTMIAACAIVLAAFSTLTSTIARSGFLELSAGFWLTLVARYVYGVARIEATFAAGSVTLVNAGGGVYALDPDDLVVSNPTTGKTYRNTSAISLGAGATLVVPVVAVEAGAGSTSVPLAISRLETTLLSVTCSNASALVGVDAEDDPALRLRCSEKLGALSPFGPWDAYTYAARNAKRLDGSGVGVSRVRLVKDGFGNVYVYVATASGAVTGTVGDLTTDLGAVDEAIQRLAAPLAVTAHVQSAAELPVDVTYQVWAYNTSGLSVAEFEAAIAARLVALMTAQPIGGNVIGADPGKLFLDALRTAIGSAAPEIFHVVVTLPVADVELSIDQVPVLRFVIVTAVNQVPPNEGVL